MNVPARCWFYIGRAVELGSPFLCSPAPSSVLASMQSTPTLRSYQFGWFELFISDAGNESLWFAKNEQYNYAMLTNFYTCGITVQPVNKTVVRWFPGQLSLQIFIERATIETLWNCCCAYLYISFPHGITGNAATQRTVSSIRRAWRRNAQLLGVYNTLIVGYLRKLRIARRKQVEQTRSCSREGWNMSSQACTAGIIIRTSRISNVGIVVRRRAKAKEVITSYNIATPMI